MLIYIVVTIIGLVVVLFGVSGIAGSMLPASHTATVSVEVRAPIETVWAAIDDPMSFPRWLAGVDRVELLPDHDGRRVFRQTQGRNSFVLEETEKQPPTLVTRTITDDNGPFSGSWEHRLDDLGDGRTRITITENGTITSPVPRAIMRFAAGYDFYLKRYARAFKAKFG